MLSTNPCVVQILKAIRRISMNDNTPEKLSFATDRHRPEFDGSSKRFPIESNPGTLPGQLTSREPRTRVADSAAMCHADSTTTHLLSYTYSCESVHERRHQNNASDSEASTMLAHTCSLCTST